MGSMMIDGRRVEFTDEPNVLAVIRKAGIDIPTLCYHSELSIYGACRLCTVENEWGKTFASCSEKPKDGMVIYTNTPRLIKYRKQIIELLLASHCRDCTTCIKSPGNVISPGSLHTGWGDCMYVHNDVRFEKYKRDVVHKDIRLMTAHQQLYVIQINVFSVVTVCVCATMYRE